jgi:hypothetical protein
MEEMVIGKLRISKWVFEELSISLVLVNYKRLVKLFLACIYLKTITIGKYKTITSLVVLYDSKTWRLFRGRELITSVRKHLVQENMWI